MKKTTYFCEECGAIVEKSCGAHPKSKVMRAEILEQDPEPDCEEEIANVLNEVKFVLN